MIKKCDSAQLYCKHGDTKATMSVTVNFGGKLRSYCSITCANDDIRESSNGVDNIIKASHAGDVFIRSIKE